MIKANNEIVLERPRPVEQRKSLELANNFVKCGIRFVPMPVLNDLDQEKLVNKRKKGLTIL